MIAGAAIFDFDGTLTVQDTLPLWLAALRGWRRVGLAYAEAGLMLQVDRLVPRGNSADARTGAKQRVLRRLVAGATLEEAEEAARAALRRVRWREEIVAALREHRAKGHRILIATGSLDVYLPTLLGDLPRDDIMATDLEVGADGRLTGRLSSPNRVRQEKAAAVRAWLDRHQPAESWGYGNRPHDVPMLALVTHARLV